MYILPAIAAVLLFGSASASGSSSSSSVNHQQGYIRGGQGGGGFKGMLMEDATSMEVRSTEISFSSCITFVSPISNW